MAFNAQEKTATTMESEEQAWTVVTVKGSRAPAPAPAPATEPKPRANSEDDSGDQLTLGPQWMRRKKEDEALDGRFRDRDRFHNFTKHAARPVANRYSREEMLSYFNAYALPDDMDLSYNVVSEEVVEPFAFQPWEPVEDVHPPNTRAGKSNLPAWFTEPSKNGAAGPSVRGRGRGRGRGGVTREGGLLPAPLRAEGEAKPFAGRGGKDGSLRPDGSQTMRSAWKREDTEGNNNHHLGGNRDTDIDVESKVDRVMAELALNRAVSAPVHSRSADIHDHHEEEDDGMLPAESRLSKFVSSRTPLLPIPTTVAPTVPSTVAPPMSRLEKLLGVSLEKTPEKDQPLLSRPGPMPISKLAEASPAAKTTPAASPSSGKPLPGFGRGKAVSAMTQPSDLAQVGSKLETSAPVESDPESPRPLWEDADVAPLKAVPETVGEAWGLTLPQNKEDLLGFAKAPNPEPRFEPTRVVSVSDEPKRSAWGKAPTQTVSAVQAVQQPVHVPSQLQQQQRMMDHQGSRVPAHTGFESSPYSTMPPQGVPVPPPQQHNIPPSHHHIPPTMLSRGYSGSNQVAPDLHPMNMQHPQQPPPQQLPAFQLRRLWFYKDPQGAVQGPFTGLEMHEWFEAGYFSPRLPVKCGEEGGYALLGSLYPIGRGVNCVPFLTAPVMPPAIVELSQPHTQQQVYAPMFANPPMPQPLEQEQQPLQHSHHRMFVNQQPGSAPPAPLHHAPPPVQPIQPKYVTPSTAATVASNTVTSNRPPAAPASAASTVGTVSGTGAGLLPTPSYPPMATPTNIEDTHDRKKGWGETPKSHKDKEAVPLDSHVESGHDSASKRIPVNLSGGSPARPGLLPTPTQQPTHISLKSTPHPIPITSVSPAHNLDAISRHPEPPAAASSVPPTKKAPWIQKPIPAEKTRTFREIQEEEVKRRAEQQRIDSELESQRASAQEEVPSFSAVLTAGSNMNQVTAPVQSPPAAASSRPVMAVKSLREIQEEEQQKAKHTVTAPVTAPVAAPLQEQFPPFKSPAAAPKVEPAAVSQKSQVTLGSFMNKQPPSAWGAAPQPPKVLESAMNQTVSTKKAKEPVNSVWSKPSSGRTESSNQVGTLTLKQIQEEEEKERQIAQQNKREREKELESSLKSLLGLGGPGSASIPFGSAWGRGNTKPVVSLAEIQQEERNRSNNARQPVKQQEQQQPVATVAKEQENIWDDEPVAATVTSSGNRWGAQTAQSNAQQTSSQPVQKPTAAGGASKATAVTAAKPESSKAAASKKKQSDTTDATAFGGVALTGEFADWCANQMQRLTGSTDITLCNFLMTVETEIEMKDYIASYLGHSANVSAFSREFIKRKFSLPVPETVNKGTVTDTSTQQSGQQSTQDKKKKKVKGGKVHPSVLGFTVNSSRIMKGEIDSVDDL